MFLRQKVGLSILLFFILFGLFNIFISNAVVFPGFTDLQNENAIEDNKRCIRAIQSHIDHLDDMCMDWAIWTDTYQYAEYSNEDYRFSNLVDIFSSSELSLLYIFNAKRQKVWGKCYDQQRDEYINIENFGDDFLYTDYLLDHIDTKSVRKGVINTSCGPMIIVSRPVLRSDRSGPINGTVVMGKILNEQYLRELQEQASVKFTFNHKDKKLFDRQHELVEKISPDNEIVISDTKFGMKAISLFKDITGRKNFALISDVQTEVTAKGGQVVKLLLISAFVMLIIYSLMFYSTINRVILNKLQILRKDISVITRTGDLSLRTRLSKNELTQNTDELGYLGKAFNDMLAKLEKAERELLEATQAKSEFLANMSHEIRTPINAIIGFSDILAEENLTREQENYVDTIRQASNNLLILINDILDFSKIEARKLDMEIVTCDLGQILRHIDSMLRPSAIKKGIDFQILQCTPLPDKIKTDFTRICQCLINLTSNAIKFTDSGHVYINVSHDKQKGTIRFEVEDTGIGIADDKQEKIFESFTQADGSTTRKYGGTGLGLCISKSLAQAMGGDITFVSKEGKGSTFTMVLPTGTDIESTGQLDTMDFVNDISADKQAKNKNSFSGSVLVAEDNPSNQMLIKILLEKVGVRVTIVTNGQDAIDEAAKCCYDLVLMDIQMPVKNGYDATRKIRSMNIETPVYALTANAMKGDDQKCKNAGCNGYLSKPIEKDKLYKVLDKCLVAQQSDMVEKVEKTKKDIDQLTDLCSENPQKTKENKKV